MARHSDTGATAAAKASTRPGKRDAQRAAPPPFRPVQLATLVDTVPTGSGWLHEMKYDGYRLAARCRRVAKRAPIRARDSTGPTGSRRIVAAVAELELRSALIDGEAVVLDADGRSNFQSLQNALKASPGAIDYFAFDLLELGGEDLTGLPLRERKRRFAEAPS
jgi:bifunctional non-homologous end joining protein LigD